VVLLLLCACEARAADNTVSWGTGSPAGGVHKITASGTYTTADGWRAFGVVLTAVPTGGGLSASAGGATANGMWGPLAINDLPAGQYTVFATISFRMGDQMQQIASPTAIVTVSN